MRRIVIVSFFAFVLCVGTDLLRAQAGIGAGNLKLNNGSGAVVTVQLPGGLLAGNYTWTLPITSSGASIFPSTGTLNNSTLRWDAASSTWMENTNLLATSAGAVTAASFAGAGTGLTGTAAALNIGGNAATATTASNVATTSLGTNATFYPLFTNSSATSASQAVDVTGGLTFNPSTNNLTATTFTGALAGNATTATTASGLTAAAWASPGTIGSTTANTGRFTTLTATTAASGLVLGSGVNATTLSSGATAARAISFPDAAGTVAISGRGATSMSLPGNPTGSANTAFFEQMGLAGSITPASSGKVFLIISGTITNNTAGDGAFVGIDYGTGAAPANGAAVSGTGAGNQVFFLNPAATTLSTPFSCNAIVTGLTIGTTYWLDAVLVPFNGGTASISQLTITAWEMP